MLPDAYKSQPVWEILTSLKVALGKLDSQPPEPYAARLRGVEEFLRFVEQFEPSDDYTGVLASDQGVANLNSWLSSLLQHVNNVGADQWGQLDNAIAHITAFIPQMLQQFGTLPASPASAHAKARYSAEANRLTKDAEKTRAALQTETAQHATEVEGLETRLSELTQRLDTTETQLAAAQESVAAALADQVETVKTTFATEAEERGDAFDAENKERAEKAQEELTRFLDNAASDRDQQAARAESILERLAEFETQSEALVDSTSRNAIAGDYGAWADKQGRQALSWTVVTVGMAVATAGVLLTLLLTGKDSDSHSAAFLVFKTGIGIAMAAAAGYCANQAAQHRHEERTAKRLHLDLAALEPFLKHVEDPEKLRTDIANRVFAPEVTEASRNAPVVQVGRGGFTLDQLINFMNAVKDKP